jgi:hypothetical protein
MDGNGNTRDREEGSLSMLLLFALYAAGNSTDYYILILIQLTEISLAIDLYR